MFLTFLQCNLWWWSKEKHNPNLFAQFSQTFVWFLSGNVYDLNMFTKYNIKAFIIFIKCWLPEKQWLLWCIQFIHIQKICLCNPQSITNSRKNMKKYIRASSLVICQHPLTTHKLTYYQERVSASCRLTCMRYLCAQCLPQ